MRFTCLNAMNDKQKSMTTRTKQDLLNVNGHNMSGPSGQRSVRFDMLTSLPLELATLVTNHLDPVDLVSARRVSKPWQCLLSSIEFCNAALSFHFPAQFNQHSAQAVDPAHAMSLAAKPLHAFKTGRPVKKASFKYTHGALPFSEGNAKGVFADYFKGKIAWNEGPNIRVYCLKTGLTVDFLCRRREPIVHLKLSDRLVVALTYNGICYAYDHITGEESTIAVGIDAIVWFGVRGLDVAFRSNQRTEPLVIWRFGSQHVKTIDSILFTGPLLFDPKLDLISVFYLTEIEKDHYSARWAKYDYGNVVALPIPEVHAKMKARRSTEESKKEKRRSYESGPITGSVILDDLDDGSYQFLGNQFFGLFPLWSSPTRTPRTLLRDQVAYMCNGTMYIASGDSTRPSPIMVHDLASTARPNEAEASQIHCHRLQSTAYTGPDGRMDPSSFRAALMGDETFMVHVGHTNMDVWCFDENVPLAHEMVAYGKEAKKRAGKRARDRELEAFDAEIQESLEEHAQLRAMPRTSSIYISPVPSSVPSPSRIPAPTPKKSRINCRAERRRENEARRIFNRNALAAAREAARNTAAEERATRKFGLRRGVYKLVVKVVGRVL